MKTMKYFGLITVLVLMFAASVPTVSAQAPGTVTVNNGDVALSGGFQSGNFPEVWDLTQGDRNYTATGETKLGK